MFAPAINGKAKNEQTLHDCIPDLESDQLLAIVNKYMDQHLERWRDSMNMIVFSALPANCRIDMVSWSLVLSFCDETYRSKFQSAIFFFGPRTGVQPECRFAVVSRMILPVGRGVSLGIEIPMNSCLILSFAALAQCKPGILLKLL